MLLTNKQESFSREEFYKEATIRRRRRRRRKQVELLVAHPSPLSLSLSLSLEFPYFCGWPLAPSFLYNRNVIFDTCVTVCCLGIIALRLRLLACPAASLNIYRNERGGGDPLALEAISFFGVVVCLCAAYSFYLGLSVFVGSPPPPHPE